MDHAQVASAVCELAAYLREHPDISLARRRQELIKPGVHPIRAADLEPILSARPQLLESWESYVENQRTPDGWYVTVRKAPGDEPEWIVARPGNTKSFVFDSQVAAFAMLIVNVVGQPLCS